MAEESIQQVHISLSFFVSQENRRLEMELLDSTEKYIEAQSQISKLQTVLDNILKEKVRRYYTTVHEENFFFHYSQQVTVMLSFPITLMPRSKFWASMGFFLGYLDFMSTEFFFSPPLSLLSLSVPLDKKKVS